MHHIFSEVRHIRRRLRHVLLTPTNDLEKKKNCFIADEKCHGLGVERESFKNKKCRISDEFGLRSPVISETISDEKCYEPLSWPASKTCLKPCVSLIFRGLGWSWIVTFGGFNPLLNECSYPTPTQPKCVSRKHASYRSFDTRVYPRVLPQ